MKVAMVSARQILDAVETWAGGCYMLRELELLVDGEETPTEFRDAFTRQRMAKSAGRVDALLIPFSPWDAPWAKKIGGWCYQVARLIGVEVKISRSDFAKGVNTAQFGRYADGLSALYVATPHGLVKTPEVPARFGHIVVYEGGSDYRNGQDSARAVCKRHPEFAANQPTPEMFWKLFSVVTRNHHARERELTERWSKARKKIGERAALMIATACKIGGEP